VRRRRALEIDGNWIVERCRAKLGDRHAGRANLTLRVTGMVLESMQGGTRLPGHEQ
jgi:hypothetical protein